jgi:parallel beta-helix repeat protein
MLAGDTVLVQAGTYYEMVQPASSGTSGNPITYKAEGTVVIDGENTRTRSFDLNGDDYIVIDGFEHYDVLDDGGSGGNVKLVDSDYVTIRNNIFRDTGRDAINISGTSTNALIENNLIYNISDDGITPAGSGNHTLRNNTIYNCSGYILEGAATAGNLYENNIFWQLNGIDNTTVATYNYNDYWGTLTGTGNINSDPLFVNAVGADFHLSHIATGQGSDSPCKDAGSDTAANLGLETRTTRTDHVTDTGTVDMGFHYPGGGIFQYRKPITIPFGNVGGSCTTYLENFPLLIKITDTDLITKARDDGYDIVFRSLEANTCAPEAAPCGLYHEVERWNSSTGELIAWVRIPRLYHDSDTTIYMYFGILVM